jgi:hypothetical protein
MAGTVSPSGPVREMRMKSESERRNDHAFTKPFATHAPDRPEDRSLPSTIFRQPLRFRILSARFLIPAGIAEISPGSRIPPCGRRPPGVWCQLCIRPRQWVAERERTSMVIATVLARPPGCECVRNRNRGWSSPARRDPRPPANFCNPSGIKTCDFLFLQSLQALE